MRNVSSIAIAVGIVSVIPAIAVVTDHPLPINGSAPQACFVKFMDTNAGSSNPFQAQAGCTGTLIRNNRLLTAAHCLKSIVNDGDMVDVLCNNGNQEYEVIGYEADPAFSQVLDGNGNTISDVHDVVIFDLKPPKKNPIAPIAIVSDPADLAALLLVPEKCSLYGYGRPDDGDNNNWGNLVIGPMDYLSPQAMNAMTGWAVDPAQNIYIGPSTHAAPGDSGGPILCTRSDGSVVQIATTMQRNQIMVDGKTIFLSLHEPTPFNAEWINSTADKPVLQHKL